MKVLVCGGRDYIDKKALYETMDSLHQEFRFTRVIQGGAKGADTLANEWAADNNISSITYVANWEQWGLEAGPLRNEEMLISEEPDLVVAFKGGDGTWDMISRAYQKEIECINID